MPNADAEAETPPLVDATTDEEFSAAFLAYVDERMTYHTEELAKLERLRELWAERQAAQEVTHERTD